MMNTRHLTIIYVKTTLFVFACLYLTVGRLLVPTVIDASPTSLYKNAAHIIWGMFLLLCIQTRHKGLIAFTIGSALFELLCAIMKWGGL